MMNQKKAIWIVIKMIIWTMKIKRTMLQEKMSRIQVKTRMMDLKMVNKRTNLRETTKMPLRVGMMQQKEEIKMKQWNDIDITHYQTC